MKAHIKNIPTIGALLAAAILLTLFSSLGECLKLHSDAQAITQLWQLFTCHIVHCTFEHLFYDAICLLVLGILLKPRELLTTLLLAAPIVSIAVLLRHPELSSYCGLSGVNCALFAVFAINVAKKNKLLGVAAIAGILLKTFIEIHADRTFFATSGFIPVHAAHIAGIAAGTIVCIINAIIASNNCKTNQMAYINIHS